MSTSPCASCLWAEIVTYPRTIVMGNAKITQLGGTNTVCRCKSIKSITITDNEMNCSNYTPKHIEQKETEE